MRRKGPIFSIQYGLVNIMWTYLQNLDLSTEWEPLRRIKTCPHNVYNNSFDFGVVKFIVTIQKFPCFLISVANTHSLIDLPGQRVFKFLGDFHVSICSFMSSFCLFDSYQMSTVLNRATTRDVKICNMIIKKVKQEKMSC